MDAAVQAVWCLHKHSCGTQSEIISAASRMQPSKKNNKGQSGDRVGYAVALSCLTLVGGKTLALLNYSSLIYSVFRFLQAREHYYRFGEERR